MSRLLPLALAGLRHRLAAFVATFLAVLLGSARMAMRRTPVEAIAAP